MERKNVYANVKNMYDMKLILGLLSGRVYAKIASDHINMTFKLRAGTFLKPRRGE